MPQMKGRYCGRDLIQLFVVQTMSFISYIGISVVNFIE